LDADRSSGGGLGESLGEELSHRNGDLFDVSFEGEVACIEKLDSGVGVSPVLLDGGPCVAQALFVGVAVLRDDGGDSCVFLMLA
jgi:hypothetical protein